MEIQQEETFANKEFYAISAKLCELITNDKLIPSSESKKIGKLSALNLKLHNQALKEFKASKGATSINANEAKCMELANEAKEILKPYL